MRLIKKILNFSLYIEVRFCKSFYVRNLRPLGLGLTLPLPLEIFESYSQLFKISENRL